MIDYLHENKYPNPNDYETSVEAYFYKVIENKNLPIELRLKAAHEIATFTALTTYGQAQQRLKLSMAYEDAIEEYKRSLQKTAT